MIDIIVQRDAGDKYGGVISNVLLSSVEAALSRGTQEVEESASVRRHNLKTLFRTGVRRGQSVRVMDALQGRVWFGIITGLSHVVEGVAVYSQLEVEEHHG